MSSRRGNKAAANRKHHPTEAAAAESGDGVKQLSGVLDIHVIESNYRELRGLLAAGLPVEIDISALYGVDTAGVQLLLAVQQEAERRGIPLRWRGDSQALSSAAERLGLTSFFAAARKHE